MMLKNFAGERMPVDQLDEKDLKFYATKGTVQAVVDACRAELERRQNGGGRRSAEARGGGSRSARTFEPANLRDIASLCGAVKDVEAAAERLKELNELGHLISPAPMVGSILNGCSLSISAVCVTNLDRETYPAKDKPSDRALHGVFLDRIAGAAGIYWLETTRLDDCSHPYYCRYQVVGKIRNFDLSWRLLPPGQKAVDLRDDGPVVKQIKARELLKEHEAERAGKPYDGDHGASEIAIARMHMESLCSTKARLRAIRGGLGIRSSYTLEELAKPFFCVTVVFTGRSEDPETQRYFDQVIAQQVFGGDDTRPGSSRLLYGPSVVQALPPRPARVVEPVTQQDDDDDDDFPLDVPPPRPTGTERY